VSNKSLVWYNPKQFAAKGYGVPSTWDEMTALAAQIRADGGTPWSLAVESGGASGWPGTDWIEDIMLRTAGPDLYDQWVAGTLDFSSPEVQRAWELFGEVATDNAMLYGGTTGAVTTFFGDVGIPLFTSPPGAFLAKQASFITDFFQNTNPTDQPLVAGEDFSFFPFPQIDAEWGTPVLGGGNVIVMFKDDADTRALMEFLCGPDFQQAVAASIGFLSANRRVDSSVLPNDLLRLNNAAIQAADVVRFDGSDLMRPEVGQGTFWTGVVDYITGGDLDAILTAIDNTP
ncbi:MAG TPA: ABC transporter substrate-binding protein, partial [Candidatus Bipolaricaulota bacterium]